MRHACFFVAMAAALAVGAPVAEAQLLYTVDTATDELYVVDVRTGDVRLVGAVGRDVYDVDLATAGGRLFALDSHTYDYVELLELDPATGAATVLGPLTVGGVPIRHAEALTAVGGVLEVGYTLMERYPNSNVIGRLDPGGAVTPQFDFFPGLVDADLDGLAASFDGRLLSTDNKPGRAVFLNEVTGAGAYRTIGSIWLGPDACCGRGDDLEFLGLRLYVSSALDGTITRVDADTGAIRERIVLSRRSPGGYSGLAAAPSRSCEPLSIGAWRRTCEEKDPFGEHERLSGYAGDVAAFAPFSSVAGAGDLCARLRPAQPNDKCAQAEAQVLALLLNIDSLRLARDCCAVDGPTVDDVLKAALALLANGARTRADCVRAQALADGVNAGGALCGP